MSFDTIFKIMDGLFRSHFEGVEGALCFVELSANVGEVVLGVLERGHEKSTAINKEGFCKNSTKNTRGILPLFRKCSRPHSILFTRRTLTGDIFADSLRKCLNLHWLE